MTIQVEASWPSLCKKDPSQIHGPFATMVLRAKLIVRLLQLHHIFSLSLAQAPSAASFPLRAPLPRGQLAWRLLLPSALASDSKLSSLPRAASSSPSSACTRSYCPSEALRSGPPLLAVVTCHPPPSHPLTHCGPVCRPTVLPPGHLGRPQPLGMPSVLTSFLLVALAHTPVQVPTPIPCTLSSPRLALSSRSSTQTPHLLTTGSRPPALRALHFPRKPLTLEPPLTWTPPQSPTDKRSHMRCL